MKVVSINVNSLRAREPRVRSYLEATEPDVVCLQETKVVDDLFPRETFTGRGYELEVFGQKTYNGVCIASRLPMSAVRRGFPDDDASAERRLIAATVGGLRIYNVYVPNGQATDSPKFAYKLDWLRRLRALLDAEEDPESPLIICGDFNIAPEDRDVHDPERWRGKVLFSDAEHAALAELQDWGLEDLFRRFVEEEGQYTWWDYRLAAFQRGWGLRIDLFLGTRAAAERCQGVEIHRDERKGEKPSDHAPVVASFAE